MKPTETYEQLLKRFNKRITQVDPEDKERISYLKGCIDTCLLYTSDAADD